MLAIVGAVRLASHCALAASSDANASCNVDDAGMASGRLRLAALGRHGGRGERIVFIIVVHRWLHARRPAVARLRARQSKGVGWKDEAASASESLARENAAVAARRETEEEVEETPSSLHEQIRGCRSGVEPAATLRPTSSPWGDFWNNNQSVTPYPEDLKAYPTPMPSVLSLAYP